MIILDDTKSLSVLASGTSNGLGQIGCINPTITENLNGSYELEFDIATNEKYFSLLKVGGLVKCLHNTSEQIFRIYFISKPINSIANVRCQHISYDLTGVVVKPFTATGAVSSVNGMLTNVIGTTPFTMTTDITNTTSVFALDIPRSFRECLGGYEGSLLDVFRGEYEWDNLTVKMLAHRGADNGVRIAYGKNLTDFTQEENIENVYTGVVGYAVVDEVTYTGNVYTKVSSNNPRVKIVDFSSDYESGDVPTVAELTTKAQTYATNNPIEVPNVNIKVSFVPLWQTEEYKDILPLERVSLGDTVHVYFEKLGVEATSRVIKTVWNVNLERYDEIELGDARANLNTVINESVDSAVENAMGDLDIDTGAIETEMLNMSKLIANGMGLHLTKDSIGRIYLHNAEDLSRSQYQYEITSNGFMLSDDYGQNWNSGWDISGNAVVNSLATITLKFLEGYGMYMRFGDINSNYIDVAPYSVNDIPQGVSFDGSGSIRLRPQGELNIQNRNSTDTNTYNTFRLNKTGSYQNNYINLINYDDQNNYITANFIELDAHYTYNNEAYNRLLIHNYASATGTSYSANMLMLEGHASSNNMYLLNRKVQDGTNYANTLSFVSSATVNTTSIANYHINANNVANIFSLSAGASQNRIAFSNNKFYSSTSSNTFAINYFEMLSSNAETSYTLSNRNYASSYSNFSTSNELTMISNSSGNTVTLRNCNSSGVNKNSLVMSTDETSTLWSANDMRVRSGGAVRVFANHSADVGSGDYYQYGSGTQDVYIGGYSVKLQASAQGRIYLYWGSTRYYLTPITLDGTNVIGWTAA